MAEVKGSMATQMATAPIVQHSSGKHPLLTMLGEPIFIPGNGKQYPRQTGWGAQKTAHPEGGTNETAASVAFKPFKGSEITMEGTIYLERFTKEGKARKRYNISLPFLKTSKGDAAGTVLVESFKGVLRDRYREFQADPDRKAEAEKASKVNGAGQWEETDE